MNNYGQNITLKDVCIQITDGTHSTVKDDEYGKSYLLSCKNLKNGYINISSKERKISKNTLEKLRKRTKTAQGDVLISSVGTIGELAIIKEKEPNYEFQRSVALLKPKIELISSYFLYYTLKNKKQLFINLAEGAVQQCLFLKPIKEFLIKILPREIQSKIVKILADIDDKIELNNKINQNLEEQAKAIFKSWFIDFEPFCGVMPDDWKEGLLGDICIPKKGKNITKKTIIHGNVPVIAGGLQPAYYHNQSNTQIPVVTISASGANAGFVQIHFSPIWASDSSYIDSTLTKYVCFNYLFLIINQNIIYDKQEGSAQPHIYPRHIASLHTVIPDEKLLNEFEELIQPIFIAIGNNRSESERLAQLRDSLLPKLMSGEINVDEVQV